MPDTDPQPDDPTTGAVAEPAPDVPETLVLPYGAWPSPIHIDDVLAKV